METKQIKISELIPQGYEIDKEKSTFENIVLKPIDEKLPLSVFDIPDLDASKYNDAFEALRHLVHLRDAWNGDWEADWEDKNQMKYIICFFEERINVMIITYSRHPLHFKTQELAEEFAIQFEDLINEAKELL